MCCGIIYKGRFGEVLIDPHLFKPCCRKKQRKQQQQEEEEDEEEEDEEEEEVEVEEAPVAVEVSIQKSHKEEEVKEAPTCQENPESAEVCDPMTTPSTSSGVGVEAGW